MAETTGLQGGPADRVSAVEMEWGFLTAGGVGVLAIGALAGALSGEACSKHGGAGDLREEVSGERLGVLGTWGTVFSKADALVDSDDRLIEGGNEKGALVWALGLPRAASGNDGNG